MIIRPEAEADVANARDWYERQRTGLGAARRSPVMRPCSVGWDGTPAPISLAVRRRSSPRYTSWQPGT